MPAALITLARHLPGDDPDALLAEFKSSIDTRLVPEMRAGIPTVVCGPGSINEAHKPNEYVAIEQVMKCEEFMRRLMDRVCEKQ